MKIVLFAGIVPVMTFNILLILGVQLILFQEQVRSAAAASSSRATATCPRLRGPIRRPSWPRRSSSRSPYSSCTSTTSLPPAPRRMPTAPRERPSAAQQPRRREEGSSSACAMARGRRALALHRAPLQLGRGAPRQRRVLPPHRALPRVALHLPHSEQPAHRGLCVLHTHIWCPF